MDDHQLDGLRKAGIVVRELADLPIELVKLQKGSSKKA